MNGDVLGGLALIETVAAELGVAESTLSEWCRRGRFPNRKLPGTRRVFIPRAEMAEFITTGCRLETVSLADGGRLVRPVKKGRT